MHYRFIRFLTILCIGMMLICGATACGSGTAKAEKESRRLAALDKRQIPLYLQDLEREDSIGSFYKNRSTKDATLDFFTGITGSSVIAEVILDSALNYEVSPALAFALAYEESKFEVSAMNKNADSIDRGLFQLNSKSFPKLTVKEFYDPAVNARNGVSHLRFCLDSGGNEVAALAMYNAGHGKVTRGATPRKTLDYVYRVLSYQEKISALFDAKVARADRGFMARFGLGFAAGPAR
jgi:hypothetical protein